VVAPAPAPDRRPRVPLYPRALEAQYARQLRARVDMTHRHTMTALSPLLSQLRLDSAQPAARTDGVRRDGVVESSIVLSLLARVRDVFDRVLGISADALRPVARQLDLFNTRQVEKSLPVRTVPRVAWGAPVDVLDGWVADNVALIKTIDARYFDDLAKVLSENIRLGTNTRDLTQILQERYNVSKARARVIARDQTAKLNGRLTEAKHTRLGITSYKWSTSGDERVRPEHVKLNGKIMQWNSPHPTEGHPGSAVQCRCVAIPVVDWMPPKGGRTGARR
jgi:SPP1 gp7 family putative phage head morphogenesis protein